MTTMAMKNAHEQQIYQDRTPQERALIAAHAQRAARLRQAMDLMLLASLKRGVEQQA